MSRNKIVLVHPEIPQNTGNIGRLSVSTESELHLVEPLGYSLDDRYIKRAGMDYWQYLNYKRHADWKVFREHRLTFPEKKMYFFTTKVTRSYWECPFESDSFLVFGSEGKGLPEELYEEYADDMFTIPMPGKFSRSLNLANSVSIVLYEALRKQSLDGNK
jgi:tRNA (cytidine/uridine-2'-O-)-methyltransferase